jgi:hypothetical protein
MQAAIVPRACLVLLDLCRCARRCAGAYPSVTFSSLGQDQREGNATCCIHVGGSILFARRDGFERHTVCLLLEKHCRCQRVHPRPLHNPPPQFSARTAWCCTQQARVWSTASGHGTQRYRTQRRQACTVTKNKKKEERVGVDCPTPRRYGRPLTPIERCGGRDVDVDCVCESLKEKVTESIVLHRACS